MATWGTLTWSTGNFGAQNDSTVSVSGIGASFDVGTSTADGTVEFGWSRLAWGENGWGIQGDVLVSGVSGSVSLGNESISIDALPILNGINSTATVGDVAITIATEVFLENNPLPDISANLGTADAGPDAMLEGIGATGSVGSVEAYNLEGWGRYFYGQFVWGATGDWANVDVTGIEMSANLGNESITGTANVDLTGETMTAAEGIVDPSPDATVTGIGFTADLAVGTVAIADVNTDVTGEAMTASLGNESITGTANLTLTGFGITAEEGIVDPAPDATVTGIGFNASLAVGTVVAGNADVTVIGEGFAAGLGVGTLDAVTFADVTGIELSANLGSVITTGNAKVIPTGIDLTMAEGTIRTLVWNQVNTGTAPLDPPGWQEVDTAA
jgi:hypothetical protein